MAQHNYVIDNQSFPATRTDINNVLQAIASNNSGASAPSTTYANQFWYETDTNKLYIRNEDNDAWIEVAVLDQANDIVSSITSETLVANIVNERTSGSGVTVDGLLIKDKEIGTTAAPATLQASAINGGQIGGRRNIAYNGAMNVAQRGTSETSSATSLRLVDRYKSTNSAGQSLTYSQESDAPDGFANSLKIKAASTFSTGATDLLGIGQLFEGQDLQHLKKGTSGALPVTLSFYVKSNLTGNVVVELLDRDSAFRHIEALVNISSANTWEYKTVTFAGDTSGALDNDNNASFDFHIYFGAGSNFTSGTLATSWATYSAGNRCVGLDLGSNNFGSSTDNFISITGVQLEVGSVSTEFETRSFGDELQLCKRYYNRVTRESGQNLYVGLCQGNSTTRAYLIKDWEVEMRANPTFSVSATADIKVFMNNASKTATAVSLATSGRQNGVLEIDVASGLTRDSAGRVFLAANGDFFDLDAEI